VNELEEVEPIIVEKRSKTCSRKKRPISKLQVPGRDPGLNRGRFFRRLGSSSRN